MSSDSDRRISYALIVLALQIVAVGLWLAWAGRLRPEAVPDTPLYDEFPWDSWQTVLSNHRMPGYAAFLKCVRLYSMEFAGVPLTQYLVYSFAVVLFYCGVRRVTLTTATACVSASMLLYSRILHGYVALVASETLAAAAGIAACGFALWRLSTSDWRVTIGLMLTSATAWMVRPGYAFLVPLIPVLTWLLDSLRPTLLRRSRMGNALVVFALTAGPIIGYSLLRYGVVGKFGIVSSGGYNQVGIAGQFLEARDLDELSTDLRPTAEAVLAQRDARKSPAGPYTDLPRLNYMRMEYWYDYTIWGEFVVAAEQTVGDDHMLVNTRLRRLAGELIRLHPRDYAVWLIKAVRQAAKKVLWDFADNPVGLLLLLLSVGTVCRPGFLARFSTADPEIRFRDTRMLLVVALTYLVLNLTVVILVCPPLGRMTDAAAVFTLSPVAVFLWEYWRRDILGGSGDRASTQ